MKKDIIAFDVETTGLDQKNDYIIQLALYKIDGETLMLKDKKDYYILPQHKFTISEQAFETHGISEEFLKDNGQKLMDIGEEILKYIGDCDYLTYNGNNFDIRFMIKDFELAGYEFPMDNRRFYDAYAMECRFTPRNLSNVYKKYMGEEMRGAHDAGSDVLATIAVFQKQLETHMLTLDDIGDWSENNILAPCGSIRNAAINGEPMKLVFSIGKYRDSDIYKVMKEDPSYIKWWSQNVAAKRTLKIARDYCKEQQALENPKKSKKKSKK